MKGLGAKMMFFESTPILGSRPHGVRQGVDGVRHLHKMAIGPYFSYGFRALAWFGFLSGDVSSSEVFLCSWYTHETSMTF